MGVGKKDGSGNLISLEADARPIVLGLTWRKVVFKATFSLDRSRIQERLGDTQLALTKSGAEIMVHATRAWAQQNRGNPNAVLLQKDVRNAFNEVRPLEFLRDCRDHAPASSRFAHYIYGTSSHLVYSGGLEACHRGQQGCPMMGPMFCLTRRRMYEEARSRIEHPRPEFEVEFADDAYSGGHVSDVWAAFKQEIALSSKYGLEFEYSKCTLHLLAGEQFRGDVSKFQPLGINIVIGCDLAVLKTPVIGSRVFLESFMAAKAKEVQEVVEAITQLPHKHVAFHILQQSLSFGRIQYWTRTAPREYISSLLELHHRLQQELLEHLVGQPLSVSQWLQARLPIKWGGLGLLSSRYEVGIRIFHVADLAYLTARHRSHAHVNRLVPGYTPSVARDFEAAARQHLSGFFPTDQEDFYNPSQPIDQPAKLQQLYETVHQDLLQGSCVAHQARLRSVAAPGAGAWLYTTPSPTRDLVFSDIAFSDIVSMRLGVPIFGEGLGCVYGHQSLDHLGHHVMDCMRTRK